MNDKDLRRVGKAERELLKSSARRPTPTAYGPRAMKSWLSSLELSRAVLPAKTWRSCASRLIPAKEPK